MRRSGRAACEQLRAESLRSLGFGLCGGGVAVERSDEVSTGLAGGCERTGGGRLLHRREA